ncbi:MAG: type II secretion system F family protein, partial [Planctomycetota bacterium]
MSIVDYKLLNNTAEISVDDSQTDSTGEQNVLQRDIFNRITTRDMSSFTRQLAALLRAGLPLVPALRALVEQLRDTGQSKTKQKNSPSQRLALIIKQVADDVSAGSSMSAALKKHPNVFSSIFVNMVAAGQVGGNLEEILQQLAMMLEKRVRLAGKVKAAIAYPAMMTVVATAVVVFLLAFVVPGITQIFVEMNRDLP